MIIDRSILNKEFELNVLCYDKIFTYDQSIHLINCAKTYLIKEKNVQKGQKVIICGGDFYIHWFFACAELGLTFIIAAHPKMHPKWLQFNQAYGKVDWVIHVPAESFDELNKEYSAETIDLDILKTYNDDTCKDIFYAISEDDLTWSISEKSDWQNNPVISKHTHQFYYDLMGRNIDILNLVEDDRCLHTRILHHGSSLGVYFLPTIKACKLHYWATEMDSRWCEKVVKKQITKAFLFGSMLTKFNTQMFSKQYDLSNLTLFVIQFLESNIIKNLIEKKSATIVSIFGSTPSSGPIFLQTTNINNYKQFHPKNFFKPLDNFYNISIENHHLTVDTPNYGVVLSQDRFEVRDGNFYFIPYDTSGKV